MRRMVAGWMLWIGLSVTTSVVSQDAGLPSTDVIYDQWSPLVTLQNSTLDPLRTWYVSPVHATVLPDGGVLIFGFVQTAVNPPHQQYGCAATILRPENIKPTGPMAVEVSPLTIPLEFTNWTPFAGGSAVDNIYCCGHTLLHDGSFFSAGATRGFSIGADFYTLGVPYATRLNPTTGAWTRIAETMKGLDPRAGTPPGYRWYPTCGRLWNKTILVAAGLAIVAKNNDLASGTPNLSVEIFNPVSGTWTVHSNFQNDPFGTTYPSGTPHEIWKGDYPHFWQLPVPALGFLDVLFFGEYGYPVGMSLNSSAGSMSGSPSPPPWVVSGNVRPGTPLDRGGDGLPLYRPNGGSSGALLPIRLPGTSTDGANNWGYHNGTIVLAGGNHPSGTYAGHQRKVDIYNPLTNQWYPTLNMGIARHHPSAVLLPTGEVAILAGHDDLPPGQEQTRRAQVLDPSQKSAGALGVIRTGNSQANEVRGYHNVAVLLPDGRVLVGGGNPGGMWAQEKATIEFWSPPYMNGLRPKIVSAPGTVKLGAQFDISYSSTDPITVVVLMGLGSITHSFDMNQRYVQLKIVAGGDPGQGSVTVEGPPDARHAQPGPYMLFILGGGRIPSEAKMVQVVD